jgi:hypothetical protein
VRGKGAGDIDLLDILALFAENLLPLVDEGTFGGVFRNRADFALG